MEIDLGRFHNTFFQKSLEVKKQLEAGLLNINLTAYDMDAVNNIFRAAHTNKRYSVTIGFKEIFQNVRPAETVFDKIRSIKLNISQSVMDFLLGSIDALRYILIKVRSGFTETSNPLQQSRTIFLRRPITLKYIFITL